MLQVLADRVENVVHNISGKLFSDLQINFVRWVCLQPSFRAVAHSLVKRQKYFNRMAGMAGAGVGIILHLPFIFWKGTFGDANVEAERVKQRSRLIVFHGAACDCILTWDLNKLDGYLDFKNYRMMYHKYRNVWSSRLVRSCEVGRGDWFCVPVLGMASQANDGNVSLIGE